MSLPLDTAKVRLQLQTASKGVAKYNNMIHCVGVIAKEEGVAGLFKGLGPGLLRQMTFATLRIGLYEPVRNYIIGDGEATIGKKILAGLATGSFAITVANPTDLVKIRLQGEGRLPPGAKRRYTGTFNAFATIARQEGILGLWKGLGPNIARNSVISSAELVSYDEFKSFFLTNQLLEDNVFCHILSGVGAGFVATVVGSPIDVTKTRIMNQKVGPTGATEYKNALDCMVQIMKKEGPGGFYKGFLPNFGRIGSWNVIMFLSFEHLKGLFSEHKM